MNSLASNNRQSWLSWFLRGILIVAFIILFAKLFEIQIIKGGYFRALSEENRIRHIPIPAPRGRILARGGEVLAGNLEVKKAVKFKANGSFEITDDLTGADSSEIIIDYRRAYALGSKTAHITGYLSEVGASDVGKINPDCPEKGPRISGFLTGTTGLEESYQCQLMGIPGEELIEVNTMGEKLRSLGRREPIAGKDLKTTVDYNLQTIVAEDMLGKKGAAIVSDVTGEVLAFYSEPSFDPNILINKNDPKEIASLLGSSDLPFFNRAVSGTFHPGSVFKPLVALAALEEGTIDKNFLYTDTGSITVGTFTYNNWYLTEYGRTEGQIGLAKAIARSTDTFFYKIGEMVGPNNIAKWADIFGFTGQTGIDIPGETKGLIPTTEWKKQKIRESWFLGDTYHMSIGQGYVAITPIEENTFIAAIAANGNLCRPRLNLEAPAKCNKIGLDQKNLDLIKKGMQMACEEGGTAYSFFDFPTKHNGQTIACKTGTAEVGTDGIPHAWFVLFTPIENPEIVATILVEKGGQGSQVAGPIARKITDYFLSR